MTASPSTAPGSDPLADLAGPGGAAARAPVVSVVLGVHDHPTALAETLAGVLSQTLGDLELVVVDDGSRDAGVQAVLADLSARDPRIRAVRKRHEGLTRALAEGCALARGRYIARIDAGDAMLPRRLERQAAALDACAGAVLATCATEFCGPDWEPLYVHGYPAAPAEGIRVVPESIGPNLLAGPTNHGSGMFRRSAYEQAGGYRWQFYYGQDWDLWYRMAELGAFAFLPEVLCRCRLMPDGISSRHRRAQERIGRCSLEAFNLRRQRLDEAPALARAAAIRPQAARPAPLSRWQRAEGLVLIGALLARNRDPRCQRYLEEALRLAPAHPRVWWHVIRGHLATRGRKPAEPQNRP